jgi:hypothetical protein
MTKVLNLGLMARNAQRNVNVKMADTAAVLTGVAHVRESGKPFIVMKVSTSRTSSRMKTKPYHNIVIFYELFKLCFRM